MGLGSAAASSASNEPPPPKRGLSSLLARRGRKIVASVLIAFVGGVGVAVFAWVKSAGESAAKKVIAGSPEAPLQIRVAQPGTFFSGSVIGDYYVFPRRRLASPAKIDKAGFASRKSSDDILDFAWAKKHGGVAGSPEVVRLELRGNNDEPVTVTAITPEIVTRQPPIKGWYIAAPGCGAAPVRIADINFDAPRPSVGYYKDNGSAGPKHLALTVTRTDIEQIELWAETRKAMVEWRANVFYSGPRGDGSVTVDDHGKPFQVSSETESNGYSFGSYNPSHPTFMRRHDWDKRGITAC